jgi:hypothetical protein
MSDLINRRTVTTILETVQEYLDVSGNVEGRLEDNTPLIEAILSQLNDTGAAIQ